MNERIVYMCFGNPFTEEMSYKENYLIRASIQQGRKVLVIASTKKYIKNTIKDVGESDIQIDDNYRIVRIKYDRVISDFITDKVRKSKRFIGLILDFRPNVIFYNTIQVYNILDAKMIKRCLPSVRIFADVSTSYTNSANNFLSKEILHRGIYKAWITRSLKYIDKIFYVNHASKEFLIEVYSIPENKMEFSPLCGEVYTRERKKEKRIQFLDRYELPTTSIIFSHSGKMDGRKKTIELIKSFSSINDKRLRLFIAGAFDNSIEKEAMELISFDERIVYLGFLSINQLTEMLCASDVYVQPLSPSQTAQTAMCCLTPVLLANIPEYYEFSSSGCIYINSVDELRNALIKIENGQVDLTSISNKTELFAKEYLDYAQCESRLFI